MSERRYALIGFLAIVAIAVLRGAMLYTPGSPAGIDGGNWLAFGTFDRPGMVYPPLIPLTFAGLVAVVGAPVATAVAGAAATAAPAFAILALLTWARRPVAGALAGLVVVSSGPVGEIAAWGGYQQPISTAAALVSLVALAAYLLGVSRAAFVIFAVSIGVVAGSSHLVAVPTVGAVVLLLAGAVVVFRRDAVRPVVAAAAFTALPFLVLAPAYVALFSTLGRAGDGIQLGDAERVLGPGWPLYLAVLVLLPAAFLLGGRRASIAASLSARDRVLAVAASAAAISWILAYVVSGEARLIHDMEVIALFALAAFVPLVREIVRDERIRGVLAAGAFVVVVVLTASGLSAFPDQVAFYHILTADRFSAIRWLAEHTPADARSILVSDLNGVSVGWWTEGMTREETLFASNLRWLRFSTEIERAKTANALLYGSGFPSAASAETIRDAGVTYVFLPSAGAFGVDPSRAPDGWQVVFSAGDAVVLAPAT
jgi:hypothetical protein